jgi:O-antigen/teichoic acid export membrane protein
MTDHDRSLRFARNVGWNLLGQAGIFALNFLLTPFLVRGLGQERYGLYILLNAVAAYLSLFSFGAGPATVRYAAQAATRGAALRYSFAFHGLGTAAGALCAALAAGALAGWMGLPEHLRPDAVFVLRCAAAGAVLAALVQACWSALQGLQRFDWQNALALGSSALIVVGAAAAVAAGRGVKAVAAWYVAANVVVLAASLLSLGRQAALKEGGRALEWREFARYSLASWLGPLAWILTFQADKFFVAKVVSLEELTYYAVPWGLLQRLQVFPASFNTALFPLMSEAGGDLGRMYARSTRALLWALLPVLALLFVLMPQFLTLWLGPEFGMRAVWPARLLILSQVFWVLVSPAHSLSASLNRPALTARGLWLQALVSLAAWFVLVPRFGILGAAAGTLLAHAALAAYCLNWARELSGLGFGRYLREAVLAPMAAAAAMALLIFPWHGQVGNWLELAALSLAGLAVFAGLAARFMAAEDKDVILRLARPR